MRLSLFPTAQAPSEARRGLESLAEELDPTSFSDLSSVVNELVTISVARGATKPINLTLGLIDGELEGALYDDGPGTRALVRAKERKEDSLVLRILESLVEEWGANPGETQIWFRMLVRRGHGAGA